MEHQMDLEVEKVADNIARRINDWQKNLPFVAISLKWPRVAGG